MSGAGFKRKMPTPSKAPAAGFVPMQSSGKATPGFYNPITGQSKYLPGAVEKDRSGDPGRRRPKKTVVTGAGSPGAPMAQGQEEGPPPVRRTPKPGHRRDVKALEQTPWVEILDTMWHRVVLGPHVLWVEVHLGRPGGRVLTSEQMLEEFHHHDENPDEHLANIHSERLSGEPLYKADVDDDLGDMVEGRGELYFKVDIDGCEVWIETSQDGTPTGHGYSTSQVRSLTSPMPQPPRQMLPYYGG